MYKFHFILIFNILVWLSCANKDEHKLSVPKMADILTEMHYADALATMYLPNDASRRFVNRNKDSLQLYYGIIFKKYNTSEKEFMESYNIYIKDPVQMDTIYKRVMNKISIQRVDKKY